MVFFGALAIVFRVDCYWERCWMLQDMDHMEASCVLYIKVGTLDELERSKFSVLTISKLGIVMITVRDDSIFGVSFMYDLGVHLRQTSPDVLSVKDCPVYM